MPHINHCISRSSHSRWWVDYVQYHFVGIGSSPLMMMMRVMMMNVDSSMDEYNIQSTYLRHHANTICHGMPSCGAYHDGNLISLNGKRSTRNKKPAMIPHIEGMNDDGAAAKPNYDVNHIRSRYQ
jgi:hypothetical protein